MYTLAALAEKSSRCSRCGACATYCPVYLASQEETLLARGKLHLAEAVGKGDIPLVGETEKRINACLLCGACSFNCPSGVPCDKIVLAARVEAVKRHGLPFLKSLAFRHVVPSSWRFNLGLKSLSLVQNYLPIDQEVGPTYRHLPFSFSGVSKQVSLPHLASRTLSQMWQDMKINKPQAKVAFFSGCLTEYVYPSIGLSLQRLLARLNIEVVRPPQTCCGTPVLMSGEIAIASKIAEENVKNFLRYGDFDYIVTTCATCGSTLRKHYAELLKDSSVEAADFTNYVMDINEFLAKHTNVVDYLGAFKGKVTYHDPCHLNRHQNVHSEPRDLILASGATLVEMEAADECCGNGGTFSVYYPELSQKILQRKVLNIRETDAECLATACPGCLMQLRRGLEKNKLPIKSMHTVELIEQAFSK